MLFMKQKRKFSAREADAILRTKKLLFAMWDSENVKAGPFHSCYLAIKDFFKESILFDPRKRRFEYGPEGMRERLFFLIGQEKPDYLLCMVGSDELNIDTLQHINLISPGTKIIAHFGDDDIDFEIFSRYYSHFIDYGIVFQQPYLRRYRDEGLTNTFLVCGANTDVFKPLDVQKKYDVSFIGAPLPSRVALVRFLRKNNVAIRIWGHGWNVYPDCADIYGGPVVEQEFVRIVNESKINLGFTRNKYNELHMKGRVFEVGACKSFQLVDYYSAYTHFFKEDSEIVMFKSERDLLRKILYYLAHEQEREKIASRMYMKVLKNNNTKEEYRKLFHWTLKEKGSNRALPETAAKVGEISREDLFLDVRTLSDKVHDYDSVVFREMRSIPYPLKNALLSYSLHITGKPISCCSYYLYTKSLGNYLSFRVYRAFKSIKKEEFNRFIILSQLAVSREFLLQHIETFRAIARGDVVDFIREENTAFVAIPLVQVHITNSMLADSIHLLDERAFEKAFQLNFAVRILSLIARKHLLSDPYMYKLAGWSLASGNTFLIRYLWRSLFNRDKRNRVHALHV